MSRPAYKTVILHPFSLLGAGEIYDSQILESGGMKTTNACTRRAPPPQYIHEVYPHAYGSKSVRPVGACFESGEMQWIGSGSLCGHFPLGLQATEHSYLQAWAGDT